MYCLFNGEYGDHDLSIPSLEVCIDTMEKNYAKWPGTIIGDFECLKVEYDWGKRDQRWTVKCQLCGEISYKYHVQDWRRGKGQKIYCHCREDAKKVAHEKEKDDRAARREKDRKNRIDNLAGKTIFGWKVPDDYDGSSKVEIWCDECGKKRTVSAKDLELGFVNACNHKIPHNYSDSKWIGKKEGHLTTIGRDGMMFIAQCDCGEVIRVRPTDLFTSKRKRACSSPKCPYCNQYEREARQNHKRGFEYEHDTYSVLKAKGLNVEKTQDIADFGVDMVIYNDDGTKIAVQAKKQNHPAGVEAMQEVYAGGRFYDCEHFAVISHSGFSTPAIKMARKLGIYCCEGEFDYPKDIGDYLCGLLPTWHSNEKLRQLYELNGEKKTLADWCALYGVNYNSVCNMVKKRNITLATALEVAAENANDAKTLYEVDGFCGTFSETCAHFGVNPVTVKYRMKKRGMTLQDAIFAPKEAQGRPSKSDVQGGAV